MEGDDCEVEGKKKKELKERNERQKDRKDNWEIEISGHL